MSALLPIEALLALAALLPQAGEAPSRALSLDPCASPRLAGTTGSLVGARTAAGHLEEAGWEVELDAREVLLTYPRRQELALFSGQGVEPAVRRVRRFDPDAIPPGDVPPYNAWSGSGRVEAPVVDVGHGLREDYERLDAAGVDVRGAIALARYGRSYRGIKVELAEEHGCAGLLLFSEGDGRDQGEVWPFGPWKPGHDAQRGSISPMARAPGDASTPGWASPPPGGAARRLGERELADALPVIPCLPIGLDDAAALLAGLEGSGPGPARALLDIDQPRELRTIYNVIATLRGQGESTVVAGSHRDAWVRGGHDSATGAVMLIRAAQHLGERARAGWRPRHTLVIGLWDAEEFGLVGSTEWGEALSDRPLAYVNADAAVSGFSFSASGTPGMLGVLRGVLETTPAHDPAQGSLWDQWSARGEPRLGLPGSGSDFAVFLHHLSVPVLDIGFRGNRGGQYHTAFDDFPVVDRYLDPGFAAHELAGRFAADLLAELAEAPGAGFDVGEAARAMAGLVRAAGAETDEAGAAWLGADRAEPLARAFDDLAQRAASVGADGGVEARFYRVLEAPEGLPGRPWYRNRLWAPGLETGYSSQTLPTLRRAALRGDASLAAALESLLRAVEDLARELNPGPHPSTPR